ncbi:streptophobe family protein [Streptomyces sp. NPDC086091]|uniref:streptophobe family protein n=1 Tax=Streptomyces sp. NPDC086091 TaxID=3365751 RepID=UPI00382BDB3C
MSPRTPADQAVARHGWPQAAGTALAGLLSMCVTAALGLWAAGAADLPDTAFPRVVAATVVTAVGGSVELSGNAGDLAGSRAGMTVMPLSVTLVGALVTAYAFLRPLRHRAVAGAAELGGWALRVAVVWLLGLLGLAFGARQTFAVSLGDDRLDALGDVFGVAPKVGFTTDVPLTVLVGLVWLAGVLLLALLVSGGAPLPRGLLRFQASVRPAAYAMVALLLAWVVLGLVVALVVAATRGDPADALAVVLLGLPNLVWLAFTVGLGATWDGRVEGPFGLPMPHVLDAVLRGEDTATVDLGTLAEQDGRVWWLVAVEAVLLLGAAFVMAARSPAGTPAWRHAVRMAVALALTVPAVCLVGRISAHYGLSLFGISGIGGSGLGGDVFLRPRVWSAVGLAALWGLVAGFLGALFARGTAGHGRVDDGERHPVGRGGRRA